MYNFLSQALFKALAEMYRVQEPERVLLLKSSENPHVMAMCQAQLESTAHGRRCRTASITPRPVPRE
jgi:hypothetical protein